jgi:glutamate synthase domain-containing protein 2/glutamate synthase domain-containing protein 3/predicted glutamine amidotransferase
MSNVEQQIKITPDSCALVAAGYPLPESGEEVVELQKKLEHRTGSLGSGFAVSRWNNQELIRKAEAKGALPDPNKNYYPLTLWRYNTDISLETILQKLQDRGILPWLTEEIPVNPGALNPAGFESRPLGGITRIISMVENPKTYDSNPTTRQEKEFAHLADTLVELQKKDFTQGEILIPSFTRVNESGFGGGIEIFKGVGTVEEIWNFYQELKEIRSKLWLTHGRFPTLTQPWWGGSHPFQQGEWIGLHNGNIISYDVHIASLKEKYALVAGTDSEAIPAMADYLMRVQGLPPEIALLTLKIPNWAQRERLTPVEREFINELSITHDDMLLDGPAAVILTNGEKVYALTGRHGVRPLHVTKRSRDGAVLIASELGPISPEATRISQGKIGTDEYAEIYRANEEIATKVIKTGDILAQATRNFGSESPIYNFIDRRKEVKEGALKKDELRRRVFNGVHGALVQFGCSMGTIRRLEEESRVGAVIIESTGEKKPLPIWRGKDVRFLTFFQIGASEVGDPSIDPDRMPIDTITHLGQRAESVIPEKPLAQIILNSPVLFSTRYLPPEWKIYKEVLTKAAKTFGTSLLDNAGGEQSIPPEILGVVSTKYENNFSASMGRIYQEVEEKINLGKNIVVISDIVIGDEEKDVIPATLVVGLVNQHLEKRGLRRRVSLIVESLEIASSAAVFKTLALGANAVSIDPRIILAAIGIGNFNLTSDPLSFHQIERDEAHARAHNLFTSWTHQMKKLMGGADITDVNNLVGNKMLLQSLGLGKEISSSLNITDDGIGKRDWEFFIRKDILPFTDLNPKFILPIKLPRHHSAEFAGSLRKYVQGGEAPATPKTDYFDLLEFKNKKESDITPKEVSLETKLYPSDGLERIINLPLVFGAISLGAAPITLHRILADVAAEQGTFYNTGEGGRPSAKSRLSRDEWTTFQVASGRFGVTMETLRHSGVIEIKIAQGAKPGIGGHLPGYKVTKTVAETRGIPEGSSAISPATHQDITSIEDLKALISLLREATGGKIPIQVKLAALPGMAWIAVGAARCGADCLVIDGFRGATGASPWAQQNEVGLPIASTIALVDDALRKEGIRDNISLIAGGGLRTTQEYLMAIALGADAAMTVTSLKEAVGCTQCGQCHTGRCPVGLTAQMGTIFEERLNYDEGKERLNQYIDLVKKDMQTQLAKLGLRSIDELRGRRDLIGIIQDEKIINALDPTITFKEGKDYSYLVAPLIKQPESGPQNQKLIYQKPIGGTAYKLVEEYGEKEAIDFSGFPMSGDRCVGVALTRLIDEAREEHPEKSKPLEIKLSGVAGHDLGAFLIPGVTIKVISKEEQITGVGDGVGKSNQGGNIIVDGSGADLAGYAKRSGKLLFSGSVDDLAGCNMRGKQGEGGPVIIIGGGVKNRAFEGMAGGTAIILGWNLPEGREIVGENFASGIFGGTIYVHTDEGKIKKHIHPDHLENLNIAKVNPDEEKMLLPELTRWCLEFGKSLDEVIGGEWIKITSKTINPLANTYSGH